MPVSIVVAVVVWLRLSLESQQAAEVNLSCTLSGGFCSRRSSFYAAFVFYTDHTLHVSLCVVCVLPSLYSICCSATATWHVSHDAAPTRTLPRLTQSVTLHSIVCAFKSFVFHLCSSPKKQNPNRVGASSVSFWAAWKKCWWIIGSCQRRWSATNANLSNCKGVSSMDLSINAYCSKLRRSSAAIHNWNLDRSQRRERAIAGRKNILHLWGS